MGVRFLTLFSHHFNSRQTQKGGAFVLPFLTFNGHSLVVNIAYSLSFVIWWPLCVQRLVSCLSYMA